MQLPLSQGYSVLKEQLQIEIVSAGVGGVKRFVMTSIDFMQFGNAGRTIILDAMRKSGLRMLVEIGFIVFLFYSNLLMGEFERSGLGRSRGLIWALRDIFTVSNFEVAVIAAIIGFVVFEFLRTRF
jgi:hypothetical protein